ncbi:MAG: hypothetical protein PVI00_18860, partial [Desulfobacterales bacterium]
MRFETKFETSAIKKGTRLLFLPLMALVVLISANTVQAPYFFDDEINITRNPHIRLTKITVDDLLRAGFESPMSSRPVAYISFGLNYYFGGYNVFGYHVVNIV